MMTKTALRKIYKEKRLAITAKDKLKWDDLMLIQLQKFYFGNAASLFTYWPMVHEPNVQLYTAYLKHSIIDLQIVYPVTDFNTTTMSAFAVNDDTLFTENNYGLTEPTNGQLIAPSSIDIVFVPLLVCDTAGFRVGFGKGFYDKYLAQCRKDIIKIGFNYFEPIEKIIDTNKFDIPLNYCITPQRIYEF